jgi:hypothetical protein
VREIWSAYVTVWRQRPWLAPILIAGVILTLFGIVGTIRRDPIAIGFVPGVLLIFLHHFLVQKAVDRP